MTIKYWQVIKDFQPQSPRYEDQHDALVLCRQLNEEEQTHSYKVIEVDI